ncbi:pyrimidine-specific ribonucleoside hydrolase RihA [Synergistales bacterium]|nr:pyrimidine-specific ribonucleoside hydrolase RihA [Synergistales bacterium]
MDCDVGTDDAIAITAALFTEDAEVVAVTAVFGNTFVERTARNALNLVRHLGSSVPVAVGASAPLKDRGNIKPDVSHGESGLGTVTLPDCGGSFHSLNAPAAIYEAAVKASGELEIIATAPLTNIAMAFLLYPELPSMIRGLYIMGGAIDGGNMTRTAEFNTWNDPEAARIAFSSGAPCFMTGLDVTRNTILNEDDARAVRGVGTKAALVVADILDFMFARRDAGGEDAIMHDALAAASALCPGCVEFREYYVDAECEGRYTFGHTFVDTRGRTGNKPNVNVAVASSLPTFKRWLLECIERSARV